MKSDILTTADAARELGISQSRVLKLIAAGRIKPTQRLGNMWLIRRADLAGVRERKPGRPAKS